MGRGGSKMDSHTVNLKAQEPSAGNLVSEPSLDFLTAWNLVACGNLEVKKTFTKVVREVLLL